jgi:hypothetical protein
MVDDQSTGGVAATDSAVMKPAPESSAPTVLDDRRPTWLWRGLAAVGVAVGLFFSYLAMSRTQPTNADGASTALQAWDVLHGNILLGGWISDVPFYTNELLVLLLAELRYGLNADVVHVCAAVEYTLLTVGVALLARGGSRGRVGFVRAGVAAAVMLVPQPGIGVSVLLLSPDHTGSAVFLLAAFLVIDVSARSERQRAPQLANGPWQADVSARSERQRAPQLANGSWQADVSARSERQRAPQLANGSWQVDRASSRRWMPYALGAILALGAISDPLVLYVGVVPVIAVCALRLWLAGEWRPWRWRGPLAALIVAAMASVVSSKLVLLGAHLVSGFRLQGVDAGPAGPAQLGHNLKLTVETLLIDFGAWFPDRSGTLQTAFGAVRLVGLLTTLVTVVIAVARAVRRSPDSLSTADNGLVDDLLVAAFLMNVFAFLLSTIPVDIGSARQVAPALFLGAALVGRVCGPWLARWFGRGVGWWRPLLAGVLAVAIVGEFVALASRPAVAHESADVAAFLVQRRLSYGLGNFWSANNITLQTGGAVQVVPVYGDRAVYAFRWLSKPDWYDPARHDARFVVIQTMYPAYGTEAGTLAQFGPPIERRQIGGVVVYLYARNLLIGLPAWCPGVAPSMAQCR